MPTRRYVTAALVVLGSCASPVRRTVSTARFANADPVWLVDDRRDVRAAPAVRPDVKQLQAFEISMTRRLDRLIESPPPLRALGTNSLDDVPTSTWFENRVGVRDVSAEDVRRGPGDATGPVLPIRVVSAKTTGQIPGFIGEDAARVRWLVKFEPTGRAAESAADLVSQRLLWLAGYHVPENHAGYLTPADVFVDARSTYKAGRTRRAMTADDLRALFARVPAGGDGRYRVLFSRFIAGKPLGPTPQEGTRPDDPNDTIPHERRRELRGLYVFAAWLQHTDFKEMGTLDTYRDDPVRPGHHAVWHYLLDFGNTLGLYAKAVRRDDGHIETWIDRDHVRSFLRFGLWTRPWEDLHDPQIPGVGAFDAHTFDPAGFSAYSPYLPFLVADELDARWAVKILLRIQPAHLRAALEAGRYEDPRAIAYLQAVLDERRRATARYWLARVSPLDDLAVRGDRVCFGDLVLVHRLDAGAAGTRYRVAAYDGRGVPLGDGVSLAAGRDGRTCAALPRDPGGADGYTILRIEVDRPRADPPAIEVHLARDPRGRRRVIGLERRPPDRSRARIAAPRSAP